MVFFSYLSNEHAWMREYWIYEVVITVGQKPYYEFCTKERGYPWSLGV